MRDDQWENITYLSGLTCGSSSRSPSDAKIIICQQLGRSTWQYFMRWKAHENALSMLVLEDITLFLILFQRAHIHRHNLRDVGGENMTSNWRTYETC